MRNIILANSLFDSFLTNWDNAFLDGDHSYWRRRDNSINCRENEDSYEYYVPLAGFKKEDLAAKFDDERVNIVAKNEDDTLSYSFLTPEETDLSKTSAKYEDGLLTITFLKTEKPKATPITID